MRTTADAFLRAVCESPDEEGPRLVFADWLEENGDPERAEFIRVQCRLEHTPEDADERPDLEGRAAALLERHRDAWVGSLKYPEKGDYNSSLERAPQAEQNRAAAVVARFEVLGEATEEALPQQKIVVKRTEKKYVLVPAAEPRLLGPGRYSVANLLVNAGDLGSGGKPASQRHTLCVTCTVSGLPVIAESVSSDVPRTGGRSTTPRRPSTRVGP